MSMRSSKNTTLNFGLVEAEVSLYKTAKSIEVPAWDQAGPNGGTIVREQVIAGTNEIYNPLEAQLKASLAAARGEEFVAEPVDQEAPTGVVVETEPAIFEVTAGEDGETVKTRIEADQIRRGRRHPNGFWDLTEPLARIDTEVSMDRIEVIGFIRRERVPRERVIGSYYLAPQPGSAKPLALLRSAMVVKERVAVVKWSKIKNQATGVIAPYGDGLIVLEMGWAEDFHPLPENCVVSTVTISEGEAAAAAQLVEAMSDSPSVMNEVIDDRRRLTAELLEKVENGEAFVIPDRTVEVSSELTIEELLELSAMDGDRVLPAIHRV